MKNLEDKVRAILYSAHQKPFTLQSDFARANALPVAVAASMGLISCLDPITQQPHGRWFITLAGHSFLLGEHEYGF